MFCTKCGNNLADNSQFCTVCGSAVEPVKEPAKQKKSKKGIIAVIAIVLVIAIVAAIVLPIKSKSSGTEIVYVLTGYTKTDADGVVEHRPINYDMNYNPIEYSVAHRGELVDMSFDENGNLTSKGSYSHFLNTNGEKKYGDKSEYYYTYKNGKIESCDVYYNGIDIATWKFEWNSKGNLQQAMITAAAEGSGLTNVRYDFEYDRNGRLITEYVWRELPVMPMPKEYKVFRLEYTYNSEGKIISYEFAATVETISNYKNVNYKSLDFEVARSKHMDISYNDFGKIQSVTIGRLEDNVREYEYDESGNIVWWDDYAYDDNGKLEYICTDKGVKTEFEYEAVEMSTEDAERYYRWEQLLQFDWSKMMYFPVTSDIVHTDVFFYYLVPNPIW